MGLFNVLFGTSDTRLIDAYQRAWREANKGYVDPYKYPYLDRELNVYAKENNCTYKEAYIFAKTGKKTWDSVDTVTFLNSEENKKESENYNNSEDNFDMDEDEEECLLLEFFKNNSNEKEKFQKLYNEYNKRLDMLCATISEIKKIDLLLEENQRKLEIIKDPTSDEYKTVIERNKELRKEKEIEEYNLFEDKKNETDACDAYYDYRNKLLERIQNN